MTDRNAYAPRSKLTASRSHLSASGRPARLCLAALLCTSAFAAFAATPDYLAPDLRQRVEQLKASLDTIPTNPTNAPERARLTWEWVNAYALNDGYVPVNATQVIASVLSAPSANSNLRDALDATIRELAFRDDDPQALGSLIATPGPFTAGEYGTIRQTYTVGTTPVQTGGGFMLARHFMANFGPWQTDAPDQPNFISIESSNSKVGFVATTTPLAGMHGGFRSTRETLTFRVASGTLEQGDTVTITWGDTRSGSPGMRMPTMSSDRMPLPIYLATHKNGLFYSLPIQPVRIQGAETAGVAGFAPSVVAPGESFEFSVRAQDRFFNRAVGEVPNWIIKLDGQPWLRINSKGAITLATTSLTEAGAYHPVIESADGTIRGSMNPILVTAEPRDRIYWGDTHGHSGFAEGIGTAERFMRWAKEDARLDFVTHSEHDIWLDDKEWEVLQHNVRTFTEEGRFAAYLGYEWSVSARNGGHHNVLFRTPDNRQRIPAQFYNTLSRLYAGLRATAKTEDVVIIPHAHQTGDYRQSDPEMETLVEIMSQHGNFEWFGRMYLQHGHQVGFTAASDNHLSQPGYSAPLGGSLSQRGGLGAILAPSHSVDAIFDGMKNLRSYATTGERIILDFSVNDVQMGQRGPFAQQREVNARVVGTAPLDEISIIKNDEVIWSQTYLDNEAGRSGRQEVLMLSFRSESTPFHPGDNPRGWRHWEGVLQVDNADLVEIRPVDTALPGQRAERSEDGTVTFSTMTRGDTSSYLLKLENVQRSTKIRLDLVETRETGGAPPIYRPQQRIPAASVALNLRDMAEGRTTFTQQVDTYTDSIVLRRVLESGPREAQISFTDDGTRQGDYYYLRVVQANDAMAWSSPVWIGGHPPQ